MNSREFPIELSFTISKGEKWLRVLHFNPSQQISQIVNILLVIELQNNFEFKFQNLEKNIGDRNWRSNRMDRI